MRAAKELAVFLSGPSLHTECLLLCSHGKMIDGFACATPGVYPKRVFGVTNGSGMCKGNWRVRRLHDASHQLAGREQAATSVDGLSYQ